MMERRGNTGHGPQEVAQLLHAPKAGKRKAADAQGSAPDAAASGMAVRQKTRSVFAYFFATALPTAEVCALLHLQPAQVHQRVRDGSLLGLIVDGTLRLPALQFHQDAEIPGLAAVLRELPKDTGTLEALIWLATPIPGLADADGIPRSPRDYLVQAGEPAQVVAIVQGLAQGRP